MIRITVLNNKFSVRLGNIDGLTVTDQLDIFRCGGIVEYRPIVTKGYIVGFQCEVHTLVILGIPTVGVTAHHTGLNCGIYRLFSSEGQAVVFAYSNGRSADVKDHAVFSIFELTLYDQLITGHNGEVITDCPFCKLQIVLRIRILDDRASTGNTNIEGFFAPNQLNGSSRNRLVFHIPAIVRRIVCIQFKVQSVIGGCVKAVIVRLHMAGLNHHVFIGCKDRLTVFDGHIGLVDHQHRVVGGVHKAALDDQGITLYDGLHTDGPEF